MPDHLHTIWTLPVADDDYSGRWRAIKAHFSRSLVKAGVKVSHSRKREYDLWQPRFWEHTIRDDEDMRRHIEYIHFNPVKHELTDRVVDWPYSTFHRFVRLGLYPSDWAGTTTEKLLDSFGE